MAKRSNHRENHVDVPCKTCGGTGLVPLVPSLQQTLNALAGGPRTASELSDHLGIPRTAMNNRLEGLRALGLVTRDRVTRGHVYAAKASR